MSVDGTQMVAEQPASIPAAQDATTATLQTALGPLAASTAQSVAQQAVADFVAPHSAALNSLTTQAQDVLAQLANQPEVKALVEQATAGLRAEMVALQSAFLTSTKTAVPQLVTTVVQDAQNVSSKTQRVVVLAVIGTVLVGALIILVSALLGNRLAQDWVAAAPAGVIGAALWLSRTGLYTPHVPTAPVVTTTQP